jgi:hypothetical protein
MRFKLLRLNPLPCENAKSFDSLGRSALPYSAFNYRLVQTQQYADQFANRFALYFDL